ncbi:hypothetical protein GQ457_12G007720 [Hibiscus cannabinus]
MVAYMGPRPPVGIHRYILVLFQQQGPLVRCSNLTSRANFSTRFFADHFPGTARRHCVFQRPKGTISRRR